MSEFGYIADHLRRSEVQCRCCGLATMRPALLAAWNKLRPVINRPIQIVSGYRCPSRNAHVHGASDSRHTKGEALDISCKSYSLYSDEAFFAFLDAGFHGIGRGNGICHIDVRPLEDAAFWRYTTDGMIRDEPAYRKFQEWQKLRNETKEG